MQISRGRGRLVFWALGVAVIALGFFARDRGPAIQSGSSQPGPQTGTARPIPREQLGYELLPLLLNAEVQQELRLSSAQRALMTEHGERYAKVAAGELRLLQTETPAASEAALVTAQVRQRRALRVEGERALAALSSEQIARFDQILFQLRSIEVYELPDVGRQLRLCAHQRLTIRGIRSTLESEVEQLLTGKQQLRLTAIEYEQAVAVAFHRAELEAQACLNEEQRKCFCAWSGEPIPFHRESLRLTIRSSLAQAR
jgi:hypothetical protein